MKQTCLAVGVGLFASLVGPGCRSENKGSETQFSAEANPETLLVRLAQRGGASFCYSLRDSTGLESDALYEQLKVASEGAIEKWVDALQGQPGWKLSRSEIAFSHMRKSSCPADGNTVAVTFYKDAKNYLPRCLEYYRSNDWQLSQGECKSFALPKRRVVWLNPPDTSDAMLASAFTHELGHLLGMGDSYGVGGNQPEGVMGTYGMKDLSPDDIAGIRSIWAAHYTRNPMPQCPPGYRVHSQEVNLHYVVCSK